MIALKLLSNLIKNGRVVTMKQCPGCNRMCYDTELFCPDCGRAMPKALYCTYCGAAITDPTMENCPSCGGLIVIDRYPKHLGTIHCTACGKPRPVISKYCTACGIANDIAPQPVTANNAVTSSKPAKLQSKTGISKVAIITAICFTALIVLPPVISFLSWYVSDKTSPEYHYTYSYNDDGSVIVNNGVDAEAVVIPDSAFRKINVDDMQGKFNTISEGDYLEITGTIGARDEWSCDLVPSELTLENREMSIRIDWEYDSQEGKYINNYYKVGDKITIRCCARHIYDTSDSMFCDGIQLIKDSEN